MAQQVLFFPACAGSDAQAVGLDPAQAIDRLRKAGAAKDVDLASVSRVFSMPDGAALEAALPIAGALGLWAEILGDQEDTAGTARILLTQTADQGDTLLVGSPAAAQALAEHGSALRLVHLAPPAQAVPTN